jgi:hypothetical protein
MFLSFISLRIRADCHEICELGTTLVPSGGSAVVSFNIRSLKSMPLCLFVLLALIYVVCRKERVVKKNCHHYSQAKRRFWESRCDLKVLPPTHISSHPVATF